MEQQEREKLLRRLNYLIEFRNACEADAYAEIDGVWVNDPYDCDYYVRAAIAVTEYKRFLREKGVFCEEDCD